jgi:myo-inositol-1(or 4)-monophosphatase
VVSEKSAAGDLVTEIDQAAERAIVEGILADRPGDAILGEEGTDRSGTTGVRWVIDPLDGTASYVRGYPGYAVSIGIEVEGHPSVGVVVDALGRLTIGVTGQGAERDGRIARPSERRTIHDSVLATGFGYDPRCGSGRLARSSR